MGLESKTRLLHVFILASWPEKSSPPGMLGALLEQLVCGLEETLEEISRAYEEQKCAIGRRGPLLRIL